MEFLSKSAASTKKIGKDFAKKIIAAESAAEQRKTALILALTGDLGGGKTTFLQGFAKGIGVKEKILSPTFVIFRKFPLLGSRRRKKNAFRHLYHFDCYRVRSAGEILSLDFGRIIADPSNIVVIEWADKVKGAIPELSVKIKFIFIGQNSRRIIIGNNACKK